MALSCISKHALGESKGLPGPVDFLRGACPTWSIAKRFLLGRHEHKGARLTASNCHAGSEFSLLRVAC